MRPRFSDFRKFAKRKMDLMVIFVVRIFRSIFKILAVNQGSMLSREIFSVPFLICRCKISVTNEPAQKKFKAKHLFLQLLSTNYPPSRTGGGGAGEREELSFIPNPISLS